MAEKPSYLGLLNAIALGEGRAHRYLRAWAEKTTNPDVRKTLETVAIREGEHSLAFEKRICELGYSVQERPDPNYEKTYALVTSDKSDLEKFQGLGYGKPNDPAQDPFTGMFEDATLDIETSELLGRYIAEERDSGRLLRGCYEALAGADPAAPGAADGALAGVLGDLRRDVAQVTAALSELRDSVASLRK